MVQLKRAVFITNIPAHYRVALIKSTSKKLKERKISLTTIFSRLTYSRRDYWNINEDNLDIDYIVLNEKNSLSFKNKLYEIGLNTVKELKKINPEIIVAAGFSVQSMLVASYCKKNNIPLIIYSGETNFTAESYKKDFLRKIIRNKISNTVNGYVVYGTKAKEYIEKSFDTKGKQIYEVINTVDTDAFREKLNKSENKERDKYIILFVGDLKKIKGVDLLINAISHLSDDVKNKITVNLVGDGDGRNELEMLARQANLSNINFIGKVNHDEISSYYKNCDLFILPSTYEPFGLVLVEAAISGKPLLASKFCGGAYDLIENGKNGYIIDPYDTKEFSVKIEEMIDFEKSKKYGKYSEMIIEKRVNIDVASDSFCKAILENII